MIFSSSSSLFLQATCTVVAESYPPYDGGCHPHPCNLDEVFDYIACACRPIKSICFNEQSCPNLQVFDLNQCQCICPSDAAASCKPSQVLDNSCQCVCESSASSCNELQQFNEDSCECECMRVIPLVIDDGSSNMSDESSTGTGSTAMGTKGTKTTRNSRKGTKSTR